MFEIHKILNEHTESLSVYIDILSGYTEILIDCTCNLSVNSDILNAHIYIYILSDSKFFY